LILSGIDGDSNIGGKKHNLEKTDYFRVKLRDLTIRKGEFADCIRCILQLKTRVLCVQSYMAIGQNSIQKNSCGKLNFAIANITSGWYHQKKRCLYYPLVI
jgi:hypothetical protein